MSDDVTIKFTADTSGLQSGMQDAAAAVNATAAVMRSGAAQIASSFGALSTAYANSSTQSVQSTAQASVQILAIEREQANARYQIALNGVKMNQALVKEEAQTAQMSNEQERAGLLALEDQRESLGRQHLQALQSTWAEGSKQYEAYQLKLETLASQSALRRQQIELTYNRQVYNSYRQTFEQIGTTVSSSIMGMIQGHETLRQATQKVLLGILQDFIQARIKMVADWAAGVAAQVTTTQMGEAAKTTAVTAGTTAQVTAQQSGAAASLAVNAAAMIRQILASAQETFAGVFGFLAPVMGPAAAGPAAAAQGAVLGAASFAVGSWQLPSDMIAQVHQGEMIVPAAQTPWAQGLMSNAAGGSTNSGITVNHATHFNISAMDSGDVKRWFKQNGRTVMRTVNESVRLGAHLGLSNLTR
jgi:hypothetical protein